MDVVDLESEYAETLARIRRRVAMLDPDELPPQWRAELAAIDPEALAAKIVRRQAMRGLTGITQR